MDAITLHGTLKCENVGLVIGVIMPSIMSTQIPRFLPTPTNVTYRRGQLATLRCSVDKLGTKFVVWRKASDPNPLTVGREKFADDPYIGVSHQATNWNLIIKNVQPRHAGVYECQVSSVHQLIRHIMLRVVDVLIADILTFKIS
ncbi:protogenin A-like isoform X6 [Octopus vulgaris]|uniref:Protogenin A-like isoform X6 n=1 Tax=Octopus vulgaris TaxID=6645 RepID=A0AA36BCC1_OCTVU|nr:protogenin A-like isoform X6 [Octopus vulgaris]